MVAKLALSFLVTTPISVDGSSRSGMSCVKVSLQSKVWAYHCFASSKAAVCRFSTSSQATSAKVTVSGSNGLPL